MCVSSEIVSGEMNGVLTTVKVGKVASVEHEDEAPQKVSHYNGASRPVNFGFIFLKRVYTEFIK